jgi:hypothetical protein
MPSYLVETFVRVPKLTPARRAVVLERMNRKLDQMPDPALAVLKGRAGQALKLQREALALSQSRRTANEEAMHSAAAKALDAKLDKLLSLLHATLVGFIEVFGGQKAALALTLREAIFRDGVAPITSRPFVEQHELIKLLIQDLRTGELAAAVVVLQLEQWVERLEELNTQYGQHITRPERVSVEVVRAADTRAWVALVEVVTAVLAVYPTNSEADLAGRQHLLIPLVEQEQEAAMLRARRRNGGSAEAPEEELPVEDTIEEEDETEVREAEALGG